MKEKMSSLSLDEKVGQLFFIGLPGVEIDSETKELLNIINPGGVCLFSRNIREAEQTRKLLDDVCSLSRIDPVLSLDQEGGLVDRLRRIMSPMPAAGSLLKEENAAELAEITAEAIRILGFNTNFAPVVDIPTERSLNTQNGLQSRFLGNSLNEVLANAGCYLKQMQDNGVLGTLKHFPGIGSIEVDSHEELPIVNLSREDFFRNDLVPYRELMADTHCVMVGHTAFPNFDLQERDQNGKLLPSSLSFNIVTKLLRQEIGFQGLIVTDDLEMGAILKNYGIGEACKMAIKAGIDMLLICANSVAVKEGFEAVISAVKSGEISKARLEESLQRIADFKNQMKPSLPFSSERLAELSKRIDMLNEKLK